MISPLRRGLANSHPTVVNIALLQKKSIVFNICVSSKPLFLRSLKSVSRVKCQATVKGGSFYEEIVRHAPASRLK
jgi:hypothetical protein